MNSLHFHTSILTIQLIFILSHTWVVQTQPYAAVYRLPSPTTTTAKAKPLGTTKAPADIIVNLSNFVLLGVLITLVHVLGYLGFTLGVGTTGKRSTEIVSFSEAAKDTAWAATLMLGGPMEIDCLRRLACQDPYLGKRQMDKSLVVASLIKSWSEFLVENYERNVKKIEISVKDGLLGKKCVAVSCYNGLEMLVS